MAKTIIWIEDDSDIIAPVIRPLEKAGYRFVRLRTAAEALEAIDQIKRADLILLDMILPPGHTERPFGRYAGKDVLRELRHTHNVKTPIVVLTVVTDEDVLRQVEDLGVADIVRKPVLPSELKERVQQVLEAPD
jgi:DNA-binding response OmpR family regulator